MVMTILAQADVYQRALEPHSEERADCNLWEGCLCKSSKLGRLQNKRYVSIKNWVAQMEL